MIALTKTLLKYFLFICAFMVASLFVLLIFLTWAAVNREVLGFGENLPTDEYLLPTHEGEFFLIDIYAKLESQLLYAYGIGAWSALWRLTMEVTSSQGYRETAFDLSTFGWSEHSNNKNLFSRTAGQTNHSASRAASHKAFCFGPRIRSWPNGRSGYNAA